MSLNFFTEEINFQLLHEETTVSWLNRIANFHDKEIEELNYIFCNDEYLFDINKKYLAHDYYTDIITFDNSEGDLLQGDLFISIERVDDNAKKEKVTLENELNRVMAHGLLHLIGFNDKSKEEKKLMSEKEDWALSLLS